MATTNSFAGIFANRGQYGPAASAPRLSGLECDPAAPVCPACGGLECLCRPRFFSGQLLTDEDLNRLDRYIVAKHKLHNRYVHGWGAVCGLEVTCDPCGNGVTVKPGYAISPCGEDIVVCEDTPVDICKLIGECRKRGAEPNCDPPRVRASDDCDSVAGPWILAICYDEKPSRGVVALRASSNCTTAGATGSAAGSRWNGTSGCGCTSQKQAVAAAPATPARRPNSQCEPTVTCETFTFRVYRAPKTGSEGLVLNAFWRRLGCCIKTFIDTFGTFPKKGDPDLWARWCCDTKQTLRDLVLESGSADCRLLQRLEAIQCPVVEKYRDPQSESGVDSAFWVELRKTGGLLILVMYELLRSCLCRTLLPACPDEADQDCVPLARVSVDQSNGCQVVSVCNWGDRKVLLTQPTISEWVAPIFQSLQAEIARVCCAPSKLEDLDAFKLDDTLAPVAAVRKRTKTTVQPLKIARAQVLPTLVESAFAARKRPANLYTLILGALGAEDQAGEPVAQPFEIENAAGYVMLNQVLRPFIEQWAPGVVEAIRQAPTPAPAPRPAPAQPAPAPSPELKQLSQTVEELRKVVDRQSAEITQLKRRRK